MPHTLKSTPHGLKPAKKRDVPRRIGRTKGGLNSKLHAVVDGQGRPVIMCLTEGQTSDHIGARILYPALPDGAAVLIGDKGYDSDEYRAALKAKRIIPCIPPRKGRKSPAGYCKTLYKQRPQGRKYVRKAQRLAAYCDKIRPMRTYFLLRNTHSRNRHILDLMSPEPNLYPASPISSCE